MPSGPSIFGFARRAALDLEALVLPPACLACGEALPAGQGRPAGGGREALCEPCRIAMRPIGPPRCGRCGQTRDRWDRPGPADGSAVAGPARRGGPAPAGAGCGFCAAWPAALAWAASAVWLETPGPARELVHALKYGGWRVAAAPMARLTARYCGGRLAEADALVPVPLGRRRQRERGHNQAAVLAEALGRLAGRPVAPALLVRSRETRTQTALHPRERRANVAGAFRVPEPRGAAGRRLVLVDDVLTTGATLGAAAQALAAAGATLVGAVTFARAVKPE